MNAYEYYRSCHPEISKDDYKNYIEKFKGSSEEQSDLIDFYQKYGGDVKGLLEHIIASENDDIPRFLEFYEKMFKEGKLEKTAKFTKTRGSVKRLADEKVDAKKEKEKMKKAKANREAAEGGGGGMADLQAMILAKRGNAFGNFVNYMENKYGGDDDEEDLLPAKGKKNKKRQNPPASDKNDEVPNKKRKI